MAGMAQTHICSCSMAGMAQPHMYACSMAGMAQPHIYTCSMAGMALTPVCELQVAVTEATQIKWESDGSSNKVKIAIGHTSV